MQWDEEYDRIVADYAAGHDVADIEQRHGLTRAEIEWLVERSADQRASRPATPPALKAGSDRQPPRETPPAPVLAAALLVAFPGVVGLVAGLVLGVMAEWWALPLMGIFLASLFGSIAYGLWRGWRGSLIAAVVLCILTFPAGLLVIVLLVAPKSSQAWFAQTR